MRPFDVFSCVSHRYNLLMIPFRIAFCDTQVGMYCAPAEEHGFICEGRPWLQLWNVGFWFWLDFGVDCFFLCDICLNFFTTYDFLNTRGEAEFEVRRGIIAWRYFCGWFPFDLITSVPVEHILYFIGEQDEGSASSFLKMIRMMRLLKLARLWRLGIFIKKNQGTPGPEPCDGSNVSALQRFHDCRALAGMHHVLCRN
jgi:hypothetical protein